MDGPDHPTWIPFAMNMDYECFLVNANYRALTYGQVQSINLYGDDRPQKEGDSISHFLYKRWKKRGEY
jgi:hypothetical protein